MGLLAGLRRRSRDRVGDVDRCRRGGVWTPEQAYPRRSRRLRRAAASARLGRASSDVAVLSATRLRRSRRIPRSPPARSCSRPTRAPTSLAGRIPSEQIVFARHGAGRVRGCRTPSRPRPRADPVRRRAAGVRLPARGRSRRRALPHRVPSPRRACGRERAIRRSSRKPTYCRAPAPRLLGVRRDGSHLFLRYTLRSS